MSTEAEIKFVKFFIVFRRLSTSTTRLLLTTTPATFNLNGANTPFSGMSFSKEHAKQALPVFYLGNSKKKPALLAVNFLNGFKPTQTTMSISSIHS